MVMAVARSGWWMRYVSTGRPGLLWLKRTWRYVEPACPVRVFTEQEARVAAQRSLLTTRACRWAIGQLRRENASIQGLARQLGTTWNTSRKRCVVFRANMPDSPLRATAIRPRAADCTHRCGRRETPVYVDLLGL